MGDRVSRSVTYTFQSWQLQGGYTTLLSIASHSHLYDNIAILSYGMHAHLMKT